MNNLITKLAFLFLIVIIYVSEVNGQTQKVSSTPISDEINKELPKWLSFSGEYRLRVEGFSGINGQRNRDDLYSLSRIRLDLTIKPTENLKIFLQAQDSRVFGFNSKPTPTIHANSIDLRQAYIEWQQKSKVGWSVKAGRQELNFGDQRLIGSLNWTNTSRTFDAIKIGYSQKNYGLEVFASSVVNVDNTVFDRHRDGKNLYGAYLKLPKIAPKTTLNTYLFWKTERPLVRSENGLIGSANIVTLGTNLIGALNPKINYEVDLMLQRGSFSTDDVRAYAAHSKINYTFSKKENIPTLFVEYNHASGDASPNDRVRGTFDQLFPTGHAKYGLTDLVGLRNMHDVWVGSVWQAHKKLKLQLDYHSIWLAKRRDGLYNAGGNLIARVAMGAKSNHVAQEIDIRATYNLRPGVDLESSYGRWIPGDFWKEATMGAKVSFAYSMLTYKF